MSSCHSSAQVAVPSSGGSVALVGHPNVGKSVLFQRLTGQRVIVSNYPGTTVELSRGNLVAYPDTAVVDTPGIVMFPPRSEDEQVTARVLLNEPLKAVIQVGDAKNIRRTLLLTVQLAEMGLPILLVLNMYDEAKSCGIELDIASLREQLNLPVVSTIAVKGTGVDGIVAQLKQIRRPGFSIEYPDVVEQALNSIVPNLPEDMPIAARSFALLWISGDPLSEDWLRERISKENYQRLLSSREGFNAQNAEPLAVLIQSTRHALAERIAVGVIENSGQTTGRLSARIGRLTTHPWWGLLILAVVLYSVYWFVGVFGAGTLVGLLEVDLLENIINPWFTSLVERFVPIALLRDLIVGPYGLWTMGVTYAVALILPIVSTFFLAFGLLEDSGYLPRLSVLSNRLFTRLGLNGKAVLPMVLGLGCVTMATLTTRILESKRDRMLATLLLALAVPCSAQLGVVMGMLAGISFTASLIWSGIVFLVLVLVGWLAARLTPGDRTPLMIELPPLRFPQMSNVVIKTVSRLEWYVKEVVPLFLIGTLLLFTLDKLGLLPGLIRLGEPLVSGWLGLPAETSAAFLIGFLRRDFAATNLFVMQNQGLLTPVQVVVAMVTITLFIPCIASAIMIAKERGTRTALGMVIFIFPFAFLVGGLLNRILLFIGWNG